MTAGGESIPEAAKRFLQVLTARLLGVHSKPVPGDDEAGDNKRKYSPDVDTQEQPPKRQQMVSQPNLPLDIERDVIQRFREEVLPTFNGGSHWNRERRLRWCAQVREATAKAHQKGQAHAGSLLGEGTVGNSKQQGTVCSLLR